MVNGKYDPTAGLSSSGIAGTSPDKDDEEKKAAADEEMKDISKKDGGKLRLLKSVVLLIDFKCIYFKIRMLYSVFDIFLWNDFIKFMFDLFFSFHLFLDLTSSLFILIWCILFEKKKISNLLCGN